MIDSRMILDKLTRREVLTGFASAAFLPMASLEAEPAASVLCFTIAVELAQLIREKKLSAREALAYLTGQDVARAEVAHTLIWRRFQRFLEKYDYFILPTTQLPAFDVNTPYPTEIAGEHLDNYIDWMKSCWYISATSNPGASVPAGFTPEGLPVGVQIVGRDKQDFSVLQLAHAFEQATGFGKRHSAIA
jgi:amidase